MLKNLIILTYNRTANNQSNFNNKKKEKGIPYNSLKKV